MRRTSSTIAITVMCYGSAAAQSSRCVDAPDVSAVFNDLLTALNSGSADALRSVVGAHWGSQRMQMGAGPLVTALNRWHWRSPHLEKAEVCAVTATSGYALMRNASRELDSAFVEIDATTRTVRSLRIPTYGRLLLDPADTVSDAARVNALDHTLRDLADAGIFAGEVLLGRDGRILYHKALGTIDRENKRAARVGELYNIASVGKMFTASAIMMLAEQHKLTIDDTLGRFLPPGERPLAAGKVPLQYLLSHTSGIVRGVDTLAAIPGTTFQYSNFGYHLLANVITAVTGLSFDAFFHSALFEPLGMKNTKRLVLSAPDSTLPPAYEVQIDSSRVRLVRNALAQTTPATGAGGMFSTAEDLFRFAEGLRTGRLLPRKTVEEMRRPRTDWGAVDYGLGIDRQRGGSIWGHNGYLPGANADVEIYGDSGYVLILLSNLPANEPVRRYVAALLGDRARSG